LTSSAAPGCVDRSGKTIDFRVVPIREKAHERQKAERPVGAMEGSVSWRNQRNLRPASAHEDESFSSPDPVQQLGEPPFRFGYADRLTSCH